MYPNAIQTSLLQLQPTPLCNMDCVYCYLPNRDQNVRMPVDIPVLALECLRDAGCLGNRLCISWHAGEPLILPVDYYEEAFDKIASAAPQRLTITHHFQTNATLISDEFCRFFKARGISVGVSLDGPQDIHDKNRPARGGSDTHKLAMQGIRKLQSHGIPFSVIAVLRHSALDRADKLFEFFSANSFRTICFNLEEVVGAHKKASLDHANTPVAVKEFFVRYLQLLQQERGEQWLREIDGRLEKLFMRTTCLEKENQPLAIVSVNWEGDISTFSPELLDIEHRSGNFIFGNVRQDKIQDILRSEKFSRINAEIQEGVAACRQTCGYFGVCGGGSPAHKLAENGSFASTETVSCRLDIKVITDLLLDHIDNSVKLTGSSHNVDSECSPTY